MADPLSVGQRVLYRRLGEKAYRESTVRTIIAPPAELASPLGIRVVLETGEIARTENVIPAGPTT
ncbi:MAG TPA: hypothetical protein VJ797_15690 [Burkholderiales bacterium]|nr:hypothetical protein [Burkholderiales bacterium]